MAPSALALLLLAASASLLRCAVVALEITGEQQRVAIERRTALRLRPAAGEPPFDATIAARGCLLNRNDGKHGGGFKLTLPPHTRGEKEFMNGLIMPAKLVAGADGHGSELECLVQKVITTGNTSVSVAAADKTNKVSGDPRWRPAHFEHYAIFQPDFGRRPYVRETEGEIVAAIDESLFGTPLTFSAFIAARPGERGSLINHSATVHGPWFRFSFPLDAASLPTTLYSLTNITLTLPTGEQIVHPRVFARAPPPEQSQSGTGSSGGGGGGNGTMPVVWQVDASRRALLADGVPVIANGWFSGGYDHESAGASKTV